MEDTTLRSLYLYKDGAAKCTVDPDSTGYDDQVAHFDKYSGAVHNDDASDGKVKNEVARLARRARRRSARTFASSHTTRTTP